MNLNENPLVSPYYTNTAEFEPVINADGYVLAETFLEMDSTVETDLSVNTGKTAGNLCMNFTENKRQEVSESELTEFMALVKINSGRTEHLISNIRNILRKHISIFPTKNRLIRALQYLRTFSRRRKSCTGTSSTVSAELQGKRRNPKTDLGTFEVGSN